MYPKIRLRSGGPPGKKGQVTLEIGLSLICVFLLLWGSLQIFLWANNRFIIRQEDYERTRVEAGSAKSDEPEKQIDESSYPKLDVFEGYGGR